MHGSSRLKVAVIGCGIGGPAAALFLARAGHEVTIFDQAEKLGPRGAGILIAPTGQFVLDRLGLLRRAVENGSKIRRLEGETLAGRKIMDLRYRRLGTGLFGLGIHRGTLFEILLEAVRKAGIEIQVGRQILGVREGHLLGSEDWSHGPYDLVVAADGAKSALRGALDLERSATPYDFGALWVSVTNWGEFPDNVLRQSYRGTRKMVGLLPSGKLRGAEGRQISLFWSIDLREVPEWRKLGLEPWKQEVVSLMPGIECLLEQIVSPDQVTVASYFDVRTRSIVQERCVLIGDAAHASSPQLGQGASLALFDAYLLSLCLATESNVVVALIEYARIRRDHVRFYQLASKWMTPFFQSNYNFLSWPRDTLMGPIGKISPIDREMIAAMAGLKEGAFRRIAMEEEILQMGFRFAFGAMGSKESDQVEVSPR